MYQDIPDIANMSLSETMSISEVAKTLKRSRAFIEVCIKHKLITAWANSNPIYQKRNYN